MVCNMRHLPDAVEAVTQTWRPSAVSAMPSFWNLPQRSPMRTVTSSNGCQACCGRPLEYHSFPSWVMPQTRTIHTDEGAWISRSASFYIFPWLPCIHRALHGADGVPQLPIVRYAKNV